MDKFPTWWVCSSENRMSRQFELTERRNVSGDLQTTFGSSWGEQVDFRGAQ